MLRKSHLRSLVKKESKIMEVPVELDYMFKSGKYQGRTIQCVMETDANYVRNLMKYGHLLLSNEAWDYWNRYYG